jgi:hypothetical protein
MLGKSSNKKYSVTKKPYIMLITAVLVIRFPLYVYFTNNYDALIAQPSLCPFKSLTGLFCLGCGITKSIVSCYYGNITHAFAHHILGSFLLLAACIVLVLCMAQMVTNRTVVKKSKYAMHIFYGLLMVLSVYNLVINTVYISTYSKQYIFKHTV